MEETKKDINKAIENLNQYISEDLIYQSRHEINKSDFDEFCIQHCEDIKTVLEYIENLKTKIQNSIIKWDKSIAWENADDRYYAIRILKELLKEE